MSLEGYIKNEIKKYELWVFFLENHGGSIGYPSGYLQSLREMGLGNAHLI
ncbi:hypothetical protein ACXFAU_23365 [Paenibacillus glucanolyticus]